jgi:hypothetical protein
VGDSPELCVGLDAHGFADLDSAVTFNCALSTAFDDGEGRRFLMGTPAQVEESMLACWGIAPMRILEDFDALPRTLNTIIAAKGCVADDCVLRRGRRVQRANKKGYRETRMPARDRKVTNKARAVLPELKGAWDGLVSGSKGCPVVIDNSDSD